MTLQPFETAKIADPAHPGPNFKQTYQNDAIRSAILQESPPCLTSLWSLLRNAPPALLVAWQARASGRDLSQLPVLGLGLGLLALGVLRLHRPLRFWRAEGCLCMERLEKGRRFQFPNEPGQPKQRVCVCEREEGEIELRMSGITQSNPWHCSQHR